MFDELAPDEQASRTRDQLAAPVTIAPADAGVFKNFLPGTFSYINRSLAEVGRAASMAGAVVPIVADKLIGDDNKGKTLTEAYFESQDNIFQSAVDYWTPKPNEVGAAGQIVGQLSGGLLQFLASPSVAVMTAQMGTGIDLVRAGVDADTALLAGDFAGLGMAAGVKIPVLGRTLGGKVATGAAGNVAQGAAVAGATQSVLEGRGYDEQAKGHDPWDIRARALDALLGAAFGGAIHVQERFALREREALSTLNQSRYVESTTMPGAPTSEADVSMHVQAIKQATEQLLRGEPVSVESPRTVPDEAKTAERVEVQDEMKRLAGDAVEPIAEPEMRGRPERVEQLDPIAAEAQTALRTFPDMQVPTGEVDASGNAVRVPAADFIAKAEAEAARADTDANVYAVAAECLLGSL